MHANIYQFTSAEVDVAAVIDMNMDVKSKNFNMNKKKTSITVISAKDNT